MRLVLLPVSGGDVKVGELSVVLLIPLRALVLLFLRLLGSELGELAMELAHLGHGVVVLIGAAEGGVAEADGDGTESGRVKGTWGVEYVEGALGGQEKEFFVEHQQKSQNHIWLYMVISGLNFPPDRY